MVFIFLYHELAKLLQPIGVYTIDQDLPMLPFVCFDIVKKALILLMRTRLKVIFSPLVVFAGGGGKE